MATLPGPRGPIRYTRDEWGYPTIEAHDELEGTFARGYLHGTDRMLQMHLLVWMAQGRAMELLGDQRLTRMVDRSVRLLGLDQGLDAAILRLPDEVRAWMQTYADGVNAAFMAQGRPAAFRALGEAPLRWGPREILLAYRMLSWFGLTSSTQLAKLAVGELVAMGVGSEALQALLGPDAASIDLDQGTRIHWPPHDALLGTPAMGGSNGFALAGHRTVSGAPILLAEFHLQMGQFPPSLYVCDVRYADGRYVYGVCAAGLPHILAGRTPEVGWTYTFGHADNVDVSWVDVQGGVAMVDGRPHPIHVENVQVKVRREGPSGVVGATRTEPMTLYRLPDGAALLTTDAPSGRLPAVRWRGMQQVDRDTAAQFRIHRADSVAEMVEIHRSVQAMSTGALFVDHHGDVAKIHTGAISHRGVSAGPRDWRPDDHHAPESARPVWHRPASGALVACNESVPGWTSFPEPAWRHERLHERLATRERWSEEQAWRVTQEEHDPMAEAMMPLWEPLLPDVPEVRTLVAWARRQSDMEPAAASACRARFHGLHDAVCRLVMERFIGAELTAGLLDDLGLLMAFQPQLDALLRLERPEVLSAQALTPLLYAAWRTSKGQRGPMVGEAPFTHFLTGGRLPSALGFSTPPVRWPGGPTSLFQTRTIEAFGETMRGGPMFHLLMDFSRKGGRYNMAGGASERRLGPGYGAGIDAWVHKEWLPIGPPLGS